MKKRNGFRNFLIAVLLTVILALLSLNVIKNKDYYKSSDRNFFSFTSMIRYSLIDNPVVSVNNLVTDLANFWDLRYENDQLRQQIQAINHWQSRNRELEDELRSLQSLLGIEDLYSDYSLIHGKVQARSIEEWDQVITIDIGSKDGVEVGDGVISSQGLIGRVIDVKKDYSVVSLLSANNEYTKVALKIETSEDYFTPAILEQYVSDNDLFTLKLLESKSTISEDMNVITSGQGGVFPSGLYVGKIDSVNKVADSMGVLAYLKSDVDFQNLKYISVVKTQ